MNMKLFASEQKVMEVLWREGDLHAGRIAEIPNDEISWNCHTTYTVIKKCIEKGAIKRQEPKFFCKALMFDGKRVVSITDDYSEDKGLVYEDTAYPEINSEVAYTSAAVETISDENDTENAATSVDDTASTAIIGGADEPTSIFLAGKLGSETETETEK